MPEEVRFVARLAGYGLLIGVVYWFISYEVAGTVLLLAFAVAAGFATAVFALDVRRQRARAGGEARVVSPPGPRARLVDWIALTPTEDEGPFIDEPDGVPAGSIAPLEFGFGAAVAALGLVFGPWLIALGLVPIVIGSSVWLRETMAEHRGLER